MFMIDLGAPSYYSLLGVTPAADAKSIRAAGDQKAAEVSRALAKTTDPEERRRLEAQHIEINGIGATLANPQLRDAYIEERPSDVLPGPAGGGAGVRRTRRPAAVDSPGRAALPDRPRSARGADHRSGAERFFGRFHGQPDPRPPAEDGAAGGRNHVSRNRGVGRALREDRTTEQMTAIRDSLASVAGTVPQTQAALSQIHHALEEVVEDNVALTRLVKGVSDAQDTLRAAVCRELDLLRSEVGGELQVQAVRQCCQELSPVLSALERLVSDGDLSDAETTRQHLVSLAMTLRTGLGRLGIEQLPVTAGTDLFDSRVHDCVRRCSPVESPMPGAARGVIVHVQEPGYTVRGRTIRSAQVWVQAAEIDDQPAKGAPS